MYNSVTKFFNLRLLQHYQQFKGRLEFDLKRLLTDAHRRYEMGDWTEESDQMILILQCLIENYGKVMAATQIQNSDKITI